MFFLFPKQCLHLGVLAELRARKRFVPARVSVLTKNVAKTLEILTFTKKVMLWLQCGGRSTNAAAATATYFSKML